MLCQLINPLAEIPASILLPLLVIITQKYTYFGNLIG